MDRALYGLAWVFIGIVASYDVAFMLNHAATASEWEMNPVMSWVICSFSEWAAAAIRLAAVLFASFVIGLDAKCRWAATIFIVVVHAVLLFGYIDLIW